MRNLNLDLEMALMIALRGSVESALATARTSLRRAIEEASR